MFANELQIIKSLTITATIFVVSSIGLYTIWRLFDRQLARWSEKTQSNLDDKVIASLRTPSKLLMFSLSLGISLQMSPVMDTLQTPLMNLVKLLVIASLIWGIKRALVALIESDQFPNSFTESSRVLFKTLAKFIIYSLGLLVVLDTLGISITPLLASLGVGSVAVALAAQETLSNLFSGFYILLDRPFRIGDCIKIEGGVEGFVTKIGWRSTHIRLFANSVAVLPNSKIAASMVTNYDFPDSEVAVTIPVSTAYEGELQRVEKVVLEVAFELQSQFPFISKTSPPTMAFTSFGDFGINFNVTLRAQRFTDCAAIRHEFIKALHTRFAAEKISIPYPQYVIQLPQTQDRL